MKTEYSQSETELIEECKTSIEKKVFQLQGISLPDFIQCASLQYANEQVEKFNSLLNID